VNESDADRAQWRFLIAAGARYGLFFCLAFAAVAWGYDALVLASASTDLFWLKLLVGLSLTLPLGIGAGALAGRSPTPLSALIWAVTGGLMGVVVGFTYFDGASLTWLVDSRLRDTAAFLPGQPLRLVTVLQVVIGVVLGGLAGLLEQVSLDNAWNHATPTFGMSVRSWGSFAICLPFAFLMGAAADQLVNAPPRTPQEAIHADIQTLLRNPGKATRSQVSESLWLFRDRLSHTYTLYLVTAPMGIQNTTVLDVAFDNGVTLRCIGVGQQVGSCRDIAQTYPGWMDQLVQAGLASDLSSLLCKTCELTVDRSVLSWLDMHRQDFTPSYAIRKERQLGGWVIMSAGFDSGHRIECRFRQAMPTVLDRCRDATPL
jgi:hypothetical protein